MIVLSWGDQEMTLSCHYEMKDCDGYGIAFVEEATLRLVMDFIQLLLNY